MKEDFLGYDLAVKLKEKGFPQIKKGTLAMYNEEGEWYSLSKTLDDYYYSFEDFDDKDCVCPTISQVLKWLRNQNIYVEVVVDDDSEEPLTYNIHMNNENVFHHHGEYFSLKDWTKCELAGIEYVIDNLI